MLEDFASEAGIYDTASGTLGTIISSDEDRARIRYVRDAYGVDGRDPSLYHLVIDSTAIDLDTCVDLVVQAALARTREPKASPPT